MCGLGAALPADVLRECSGADLRPGDVGRGNMCGHKYAPHPIAGVAVVVPTAPALLSDVAAQYMWQLLC